MRTWLLALTPLFPLALGCGAPAEPAQSPEGPAQEEAASEASDGPVNEPKSDESAGADKPSESSAPASEQDVTAILQLVVDDPELDNYLHLGQPGRFPLQVAGDRLPSGLKLVKATEPVKVVDGPKSKKDAVLVLTEIDVRGDKAMVRYRYDVENVRGTVTLAKTPHGWELKNSRLVER